LNQTLSQTALIQCVRGWQTESPRYEVTKENVVRIVAFKNKARSTALLSEPSDNVDYFLEHWGSEVYGSDDQGHMLWVERISTIKAVELLER
jgi:hypothetical protein